MPTGKLKGNFFEALENSYFDQSDTDLRLNVVVSLRKYPKYLVVTE
jgi:hypothetical protein